VSPGTRKLRRAPTGQNVFQSRLVFWLAACAAVVLALWLLSEILRRLVGESVDLHPVWLFLALLAFGYLFGFIGLRVAVLITASIGVLARFARRRYLESSLHIGGTF
jgi:predicted PurR-regulated permease PerM